MAAKQKRKSKGKFLTAAILIAVILIILINAFSILAACCPSFVNSFLMSLVHPTTLENEASANLQLVILSDVNFEAALLSSGLSIIGIAISVWAALNITNALERKEYEEIRDRSDDAHKLISELEENMDFIAYDTFLQALLTTDKDESSVYFYEKFSANKISRHENFFTLAKIEHLFRQVYEMHNSVQHFDEELIEKANEAIGYIENFSSKDKTIKTYLDFRNADFKYYSGYVANTAKEKYECYSTAINQYLQIFPRLGLKLPQYCDDNAIPELPDKNKRKLLIYMMNSVGDACSKIVQIKSKLTGNNLPTDARVDEEELRKYGNMALFFCSCAANWADSYNDVEINTKELHHFEVYYRNCGCAYERYDIAFGTFGDHADIIIENYKKAFYHVIKGTRVSAQRIQSIYHTLLSYWKRYFDHSILFRGVNKSINPFDSDETMQAALKYPYSIDSKQIEYLRSMIDITEIAMNDTPRNNLPYVMNGFAYTYVLLLKLAKIDVIAKEFSDDNQNYLEKIERAIHMLSVMNVNDGYSSELSKRHTMLDRKVLQLQSKNRDDAADMCAV